ncbi:MAG: rod shape-determining protein MreC [Gemmatimonadaceae bacterium]
MARAARFSNRLDLVLFAGCVLLSLVSMVLPPDLREPVASVLRRSLVAPLVRLQQGAERWRGAYLSAQREELRRDTLALAASRVPTLESENERLRQMLGLGSKLQWGFIPAEALSGRGRIEDFTITLSAGSKAGIGERSLVVAPEGVVGVVQTVDPSMSLAILFAHPDFRVSAMSADGSAFGIVQPHIAGSSTPPQSTFLQSERWLLELRGVPFRSSLKPGTVVYSSGLGGIYPRGIPVGIVLGEIKTAEAWARTYLLRPSVNPAEITAVMVLTPKRGTSALTNVWADISSVDSASRRIVVAGDSLARQAASAEAAARRAAIDSALRASGVVPPGDSAAVRAESVSVTIPGAPAIPRSPTTAPTTARPRDSTSGARRPRPDSARRDTTARARP